MRKILFYIGLGIALVGVVLTVPGIIINGIGNIMVEYGERK